MTTISIDPSCRPRMQTRWVCRNGMLVNAGLQGDLAALANQIARFRTKQLFRGGGDVTAPTDDRVWRFAGHIGPYTRGVVARIVTAPATQVAQASNPHVLLTLYDTSGNVIASGNSYFGYAWGMTPDEKPAEWGLVSIGLDVSAYRNTSFRAVLQAGEEARPVSCTVYEIAMPPDTDNGYLLQQYSVGQPILDEDRAALVEMAHALYKWGAAPCFAFSSSTDATAQSTPQITVIGRNVVDNVALTTNPGTDDHLGFYIDLGVCSRKTKSTVPVKLECYAGCPGGSGTVVLVDASLTTHATFNVSGAAAWQTPQTVNLPADMRKYYVAHAGDGINSITTYAFTAYQYTA